jgi:hypothetical protein
LVRERGRENGINPLHAYIGFATPNRFIAALKGNAGVTPQRYRLSGKSANR